MTTETTTTTPPAGNAPPPPAAGAGGAPPPPAAPPPSALGEAAGAKPVEGAKPTETKPAEGAKPPAEVKPLAVPKGFESISDAINASVKELGLEGEKAQKFADTVATLDSARSKVLDTAAAQQESKWLEEAKADPDIGGPKWGESMKSVSKALSKFGGPMVKVGDREVPQLAALLERAGLGNNKHVLKAFALVGAALKDDSIAGTEKTVPKTEGRVPDHVALYGPKP